MRSAINTALDFILPPLCIHCRKEGVWLCAQAEKTLAYMKPMVDPLAIPGVDLVVCRGDYNEPILAALIQRIKYDFWTGVGTTLPDLMTSVIPLIAPLETDTVIIPVPLHRRRRLWRGFNQSELVAEALSQTMKYPVDTFLQRHRWTTPQVQLKGQARTGNVHDAFRFRTVAKAPYSAILVDDVITTGSTIRECASVLRQYGVKHITAVALAKG